MTQARYDAPNNAKTRPNPAASYPPGCTARGYDAAPGQNNAAYNAPYDAPYVTARLEEAGRTLLCLPNTGHSTHLRTSSLEIVRGAMEAYGYTQPRLRPPTPSAAAITRMDEAYAWLQRIPEEKYVLRRILGARSLVHPLTDRHLYPWRRLATALGADHKAIQRWHAQAIALILTTLTRPPHP